MGMTPIGGKKMTIFKLRKMLEATEEAEKELAGYLISKVKETTMSVPTNTISEIGNLLHDMRMFIEEIELD